MSDCNIVYLISKRTTYVDQMSDEELALWNILSLLSEVDASAWRLEFVTGMNKNKGDNDEYLIGDVDCQAKNVIVTCCKESNASPANSDWMRSGRSCICAGVSHRHRSHTSQTHTAATRAD